MGDEIKLLCSQKNSHNSANELKNIFLSRFKLSDGFWRNLLYSCCPEGLGRVNEKLENGGNLSRSDFQPDEDCFQDGSCSNVGNDGKHSAVEYKTPLLKTLSNPRFGHSPSLFSPSVAVDNHARGPSSSTPLSWRLVLSSIAPGTPSSTTTPTSTSNILYNSFKTPVRTVLDQSLPNTKTTSSKLSRSLSATLEMDPVDHMNSSWTSSLATPPEHEGKSHNSDLEGASLLNVSGIAAEDGVFGVAGKNRMSKGVARVLFRNQSQDFQGNVFAKDNSLDCSTTLNSCALVKMSAYLNLTAKEQNCDQSVELKNDRTAVVAEQYLTYSQGDMESAARKSKHIVDDGVTDETNDATTEEVFERPSFTRGSQKGSVSTQNELTHMKKSTEDRFYTSLMSPLHGSVVQAMVEFSAIVDASKPCITGENNFLVENHLKNDYFQETKHPTSDEDSPVNAQTSNDGDAKCSSAIVAVDLSRRCVQTKDDDNQSLFDMDTLSEFPLDYDFSEHKVNPNFEKTAMKSESLQNNKDSMNHSFHDNIPTNSGRNGIKSEQSSFNVLPFVENNEKVNEVEQRSEESFDKSTELGTDSGNGRNSMDTEENSSALAERSGMLAVERSSDKDNDRSICGSIKREEESQGEISTTKMETASQILRDLSLRHLFDITCEVNGILDSHMSETRSNGASRVNFNLACNDAFDGKNGHFHAELQIRANSSRVPFRTEQKKKPSNSTVTARDIQFQSVSEVFMSKGREIITTQIDKRGQRISEDMVRNEEIKYDVNRSTADETCSGFSTKQENKLLASKESANRAERNVNGYDVVEKCARNDERAFAGFFTASGRKVILSEEALDKAKRIVNEVNEDEERECQDGPIRDGKSSLQFSTASGRKLTVPEKSIGEGRRDLSEADTEICGKPADSFSIASRKKVVFSEGSPRKMGKVANGVDKDIRSEWQGHRRVNEKHRVGFSTASGKAVVVSEESLKKARKILEVDVDHERECQESSIVDKKTSIQFSTASGMKGTVGEKSVEETRRILNRADTEISGKHIDRSSTALRKKVAFPEESPRKCRKILNGVGYDITSEWHNCGRIFQKPRIGFLTASGKEVVVSEESMERAKKILNEVDVAQDCECQDSAVVNKKTSFQFSTGSGKKVKVGEKSIEEARRILNKADTEMNGKRVNGSSSTASRKSEESPRKFRKIVNGVDEDIANERHDCGKMNEKPRVGFSTASVVSEETMKKASKILVGGLNVNESVSIGLPSERKVNVGDETLKEPTAILEEVDCFLTASDRKVTISKGCSRNSESFLNEKDKDQRNKYQGGKVLNKKVSIGFTTASGKEVNVSEESLKIARTILNKVENAEKTTRNDYRNSEEESGVRFTNVDGKTFGVSADSPEKSRNTYGPENNDLENKNIDHRSVYGKVTVGSPTALGSQVTFAKRSLEKARKSLNDEDNSNENVCKHRERVLQEPVMKNATVKHSISENSVYKGENAIFEEDCSKQAGTENNSGFSTASVTDVVPENLLVKSGEILEIVEHQEMKNNDMRSDKEPDSSRPEYIPSDLKISNSSLGTNCFQNESSTLNASSDDMSERTRNEILESLGMLLDESFMGLSQVDGMSKQESDRGEQKTPFHETNEEIGPKKNFKRQSSETESESGRPSKAFRIDKDLPFVADKSSFHGEPESSRIYMKPYNSDPLEVYCDRRYSRFKSPIKTAEVSPDCRSQLASRNQSTETGTFFTPRRSRSNSVMNVKTNPRARRKSNSHFVTPYRTSDCNQNRRNSDCSMPQTITRNNSNRDRSVLNGYSGTRSNRIGSVDPKNEKCRVKPQPGSIYKSRSNPSFKRIRFGDYVGDSSRTCSSNKLKNGISPSVLSISCANAHSYRFKGSDFFSDNACQTNAGVRFTDGAILFLGEDKCCGVEEFTKAFLCSPGVDSDLVNEDWIANHYRWIIWKLASYEVSYPHLFFGRCLTPDMVLCQLKYRYDREIDRCERSAIKKILERDDTPSRGMVLCVSNMDAADPNSELRNGRQANREKTSLEKRRIILMTDGWYSVRVELDEYLQRLAKEGKIFIGQKLYIQGTEIVGSDQAVSPLEAPCGLRLRIHGNSTRPAKKFSRLGFHCTNNAFSVPIKSLSSDGGLVSCIKVIVARQYPLQFMEKQSDGSCVFRNPRCEERVAKGFDAEIQKKREKTMYQLQVEMEKEEIQIKACKRRRRDASSARKIENLYDGNELFEAINNATDPRSVEDTLSDEQKKILDNYRRSFQDSKIAIMRKRFDEAWKKLGDDETLERNVVPVLKVKLVDNLPQRSNRTPGTALLTVWRPSEHIITMLGERKHLKVFNVHASRYGKGTADIQLSANRSTVYKELPETKCPDIFQARKIYTLNELSKGLKPGVEVDVVAVVISLSSQPNLTVVYMADSGLNLVRLKIWGGLEDHALEDILKEKTFVAISNLISQPDRRSRIPSLKYHELSVVTTNPSNKMLKHKLRELKKAVVNPSNFATKAKAKLNELCGEVSTLSTPAGSSGQGLCTTPVNLMSGNGQVVLQGGGAKKVSSVSLNSETPHSSTSMTSYKPGNIIQSRKRLSQLKRRKLDLIPNPPPLSPLPNALPDSVRKEFKVPRRIITQSKENDTSDMNGPSHNMVNSNGIIQ